ncbi:MAG TPA: metal ABC transporter permease [Candidatus Babeliales bacterium]|nr:metal ABC transporter permease [Candidatus Babeliales bacterium]
MARKAESRMSIVQIELLAIALVAALACTLPGVFLVLRGVALMSDAISHAILLGIVGTFLVVQQLHSHWLLWGAVAAGMATVWCTEKLIQTGRMKKETAIGLVFPFFFSIAVILITLYARNVHLDSDMVLLGDIAFAPFYRLQIGEWDLGPYALWQLGGVVLCNMAVITLFFKELKLVTFDPEYAQVSGFSPVSMHYVIMLLASITAVSAFDIVGSIVVVALMITPAATAFLLTQQLHTMISLALFFGAISACCGFFFAMACDVSIAGSIAMMAGFLFIGVFGASHAKRLFLARV